jgi:hypothetical protein
MFPNREVETRGSGGCPFLLNRGLNRPCRLGGLGGGSRDRLWPWRHNLRWRWSWLRRARVIGAGGLLELRQPLQPDPSLLDLLPETCCAFVYPGCAGTVSGGWSEPVRIRIRPHGRRRVQLREGVTGRLPTRPSPWTRNSSRFPIYVLLYPGGLPAECSGRFPFELKVVCNLVCALVSQVEAAFWDKEESPERTF